MLIDENNMIEKANKKAAKKANKGKRN